MKKIEVKFVTSLLDSPWWCDDNLASAPWLKFLTKEDLLDQCDKAGLEISNGCCVNPDCPDVCIINIEAQVLSY